MHLCSRHSMHYVTVMASPDEMGISPSVRMQDTALSVLAGCSQYLVVCRSDHCPCVNSFKHWELANNRIEMNMCEYVCVPTCCEVGLQSAGRQDGCGFITFHPVCFELSSLQAMF